MLGGRFDSGFFERTGQYRGEFTLDPLGGGLAGVTFALVDRSDADGEFVGHERLVNVKTFAVTAPIIGAQGRVEGEAFGVGLGGHDVDGAGGGAETEEIGIGAAGNFDGGDVIKIEWDRVVAGEISERGVRAAGTLAGRADAADAIRLLGVRLDLVVHATGAVAVESSKVFRALGAGFVLEHVVNIQCGRIEHLLLGDDGDGSSEVLEL